MNYQLGAVTITDFQAGGTGDRLDVDAFLAARTTGWTSAVNPFDPGHLSLIQNGADALLLIDLSGGGDAFQTFVTFRNLDAGLLEQNNLGFAVARTIGTSGDDELKGSGAGEVFRLEAGGQLTADEAGARVPMTVLEAAEVDSRLGERGREILAAVYRELVRKPVD